MDINKDSNEGVVCFWCHEYINPNDEGKQKQIKSFIPCPRCKKIMDDSVTIVECLIDVKDSKIPPIATDKNGRRYPTGRWICIEPESKLAKENSWYKGDMITCDTEYMDKCMNVLNSILQRKGGANIDKIL